MSDNEKDDRQKELVAMFQARRETDPNAARKGLAAFINDQLNEFSEGLAILVHKLGYEYNSLTAVVISEDPEDEYAHQGITLAMLQNDCSDEIIDHIMEQLTDIAQQCKVELPKKREEMMEKMREDVEEANDDDAAAQFMKGQKAARETLGAMFSDEEKKEMGI